jgi:hypothetical protein
VSRSPRVFSRLARIALAGRDASEVYLLRQEIVFSGGSHGGEIFFARSSDGGRTFGEPANLTDSPAAEGKGRPCVLWAPFPGPRGRSLALGCTNSLDGRASFTRPSIVPGSLDAGLGANGTQQGLRARARCGRCRARRAREEHVQSERGDPHVPAPRAGRGAPIRGKIRERRTCAALDRREGSP